MFEMRQFEWFSNNVYCVYLYCHLSRTCRPSVSNVLSDFGSIPITTRDQNGTIFKTSSHSLMSLVRRGMSDKRSPDNEEAFDMTEPSINGGEPIVPENENKDSISSPPRPGSCGSRKSCLKVSKSPDTRAVSFDAAAVKERVNADQSLSSLSAVDTTESAAATAVLTMAAAAANTTSSSRLQLRHVQNCNERRRIFEDNLAAVCMGFVLAFLVCHFPRLLLNMHELITMKVAMKCLNIGHHPFSVWSMVTIRYLLLSWVMTRHGPVPRRPEPCRGAPSPIQNKIIMTGFSFQCKPFPIGCEFCYQHFGLLPVELSFSRRMCQDYQGKLQLFP